MEDRKAVALLSHQVNKASAVTNTLLVKNSGKKANVVNSYKSVLLGQQVNIGEINNKQANVVNNKDSNMCVDYQRKT